MMSTTVLSIVPFDQSLEIVQTKFSRVEYNMKAMRHNKSQNSTMNSK